MDTTSRESSDPEPNGQNQDGVSERGSRDDGQSAEQSPGSTQSRGLPDHPKDNRGQPPLDDSQGEGDRPDNNIEQQLLDDSQREEDLPDNNIEQQLLEDSQREGDLPDNNIEQQLLDDSQREEDLPDNNIEQQLLEDNQRKGGLPDNNIEQQLLDDSQREEDFSTDGPFCPGCCSLRCRVHTMLPRLAGRDFSSERLHITYLMGSPFRAPRIRIDDLSRLHKGDHCCIVPSNIVIRSFCPEHHMIVTEVKNGSFKAVHFQRLGCGEDKELETDFSFANKKIIKWGRSFHLYLVVHHDQNCHSPDQVVALARKELHSYSCDTCCCGDCSCKGCTSSGCMLFCNCEALASACKVLRGGMRVNAITDLEVGDNGVLNKITKTDHFIVEGISGNTIDMVRFGGCCQVNCKKARRQTFIFDDTRKKAHKPNSKCEKKCNLYNVDVIQHSNTTCLAVDKTRQRAIDMEKNRQHIKWKRSSRDLAFKCKMNTPDLECGIETIDNNADLDPVPKEVKTATSETHNDSSCGQILSGIKMIYGGGVKLLKIIGRITLRAGILYVAEVNEYFFLALMLFIEIVLCLVDIHNTWKLRARGRTYIPRRTVWFAIGKRLVRSICQSAGAFVGAKVGELRIPVRDVDTIVGGAVGFLVGLLVAWTINNMIECCEDSDCSQDQTPRQGTDSKQ